MKVITRWDIGALTESIAENYHKNPTRKNLLILVAQYYASTNRPEKACDILESLITNQK